MREYFIPPAALAVALVLIVPPAARAAEGVPLDVAVGKAIEKGAGYLWGRQQGDGSWPDPGNGGLQVEGNDRQVGCSSLVAYSLMASGAKVGDPRIVKALKWLEDQKYTAWTYAVSLRCQAWLEAALQDEQYKPKLFRDAVALIKAGGRGPKPIGSYGYRVDLNRGASLKDDDLSNGQYGVLGVWAAYQLNGEVPRQYWAEVMKYWMGKQERDGGWKYTGGDKASTGTMTSAGLATIFVCVDAVLADRFTRCRRTDDVIVLRNALTWFDRNFPASLKDETVCHGGHGDMYYYLFGVERVGLASGYKYFGKVDWYRLGAKWLLDQQRPDGSWQGKWGTEVATAYALLFLARGQHAVLFNRLEYDGDWNNRPRALANFCRWARRSFEQDVYWQIINLKVDPADWHDAPIVVITGSVAPKFSDDDLAHLREYVQQGGTLLSITECRGQPFQNGIRETYKKLFPGRELAELPRDHELYTVHAKLAGNPPVFAITNGARPLVMHFDEDLAVTWQLNRWLTQRASYDIAANVAMYVTGKQFRHRGGDHWPKRPGKADGPTVKLVRVRYDGNWEPEPLAWERVSRRLAGDVKVNLDAAGVVDLKDLASCGAAVAALTGTSRLNASDADKAAIKAFVEGGGTLFVDAAGGSANAAGPFAESAEALIEDIFGRRSLRTLAETSELFRMKGHEIDRVHYHPDTRRRLATTQAQLKGVLVGDRVGVVFSREDLTVALIGCTPACCDGYTPDSAYAIARYLILYAAKDKKK